MSALSEPDFSVSITRAGTAVTAAVIGELDVATSPRLARALENLPRDCVDVTLDLVGVSFADAAGMLRLARSQHRLTHQGRTLSISDASADVITAMRASGTLDEFSFAESTRSSAFGISSAARRPHQDELVLDVVLRTLRGTD